MRHPSYSRNRGFTLIEVVVSLTVFSLIMVAAVSGLRTIARSQQSLETVAERSEEIRLVSQFIRSTLEACARTQGSSGGGISVGGNSSVQTDQGNRYLLGGADWVEMNTNLLIGAGFGGNFLIRMQAEEDELSLRWQAPLRDYETAVWDQIEPYAVVDELEQIQIRYLAVGATDWQQEWIDKNNLPAAIGITLQVQARYWPEIVVNLL